MPGAICSLVATFTPQVQSLFFVGLPHLRPLRGFPIPDVPSKPPGPLSGDPATVPASLRSGSAAKSVCFAQRLRNGSLRAKTILCCALEENGLVVIVSDIKESGTH